MPPLRQEYSITRTGLTTAQPLAMSSEEWLEQGQYRSSSGWSSPYLSWPLDSERRMPPSSNQFNNFNMDEETFGGWVPEYSQPTQYQPTYPFPLSDAPPTLRQHGQYHGPKTSHLYAGANDGAGSSNDIETDPPVDPPAEPPKDPPQPSNAKRLQLTMELAEQKARRLEEMRQEVEEAERAHDEHVRYYNLPWQIEPPQPTGNTDNDTPWLGIKPMVIRAPLPFDGKYDDIERFVGDCFTYFEVFSPFFQLSSQRVAFAASYLEGSAKDWWVHKRQEFWTLPDWTGAPRRFRYPSWEEFVGLIFAQFHDPATEDIHEKKMFDLRMGKGPAISYFQELEIEAKKLGCRADDGARGLMVKAI
ncbi:uncharacterized protein ARMOST_00569 [Armillaria ostoyae]|uniref:Retrotransposon gag domain-containing protein n=1 Tax=Armillaria ostoyae TaxID=47428 RepID=A0A284QLH3_ARMOS|nr:uncharacterized protein ARMOST_00569 [Armillaria ostoyae]